MSRPPGSWWRPGSSPEKTCAELVDLAYQRAGVQLFDDGRQPLDVTPADLADLLLKEIA
jgi:hypothetical protein